MHGRVGGEAGSRQPGLHHAQPAGGEDRALEGLVGLQADDHLVLTVDIAGRVGEHAGGRRRIHVEHALLLLLLEIGLQLRPHRLRARRRADQEGLVAPVGRDVAHDEVAHVDRGAPAAGLEAAPAMPASLSGRGQVDAFHCVSSRRSDADHVAAWPSRGGLPLRSKGSPTWPPQLRGRSINGRIVRERRDRTGRERLSIFNKSAAMTPASGSGSEKPVRRPGTSSSVPHPDPWTIVRLMPRA